MTKRETPQTPETGKQPKNQPSERTKYQTGESVLIHRNQIKNAPYNPRQISKSNDARLMDSIKTHHLVGPLIWNVRTGHLVGGHQRLKKIDQLEQKKEGDYSIEVTKVDLSPEKEKALNVVLNNKNVQGDWDLDLLRGVMEDLHMNDVKFEEAGFSEFDLQMFGDEWTFGAIAEQSDEEAELVAEFESMKAEATAFDPEFRQEVNRFTGNPAEQDGMTEDYSDSESYESQEEEVSEDAEPAKKPKLDMNAKIDPETGEKIWTQEQRDAFAKIRKKHHDVTAPEIQGDVIISMAFQSEEQLKKFIEKTGADPDSRYWNITVIEAMFGFSLR